MANFAQFCCRRTARRTLQRGSVTGVVVLWLLLAMIPEYTPLFGQPAQWTVSPLAFVDLRATTSSDVAFSAGGNGCMILLKRDGISLRNHSGSVGLKFLGANRDRKS